MLYRKKASPIYCIILSLLLGFTFIQSFSQEDPAWDNSQNNNWPASFELVKFPSSEDGKMQKAYLYKSKGEKLQPLIVSLHTWSGDYSQKDPLAKEIIARDWNYIHPDFRGANNKPEAMGSPLVISDIEDAIRYSLENTNSNPEEVHIIGVSGGGYATLLAYMNIPYPIKSFSAWAPISDIEAWYWESVGRKQKYAGDILNSLSQDSIFKPEEARKRSPIWQDFPRELRENSQLYIYEGIHDGYEGSVPITHSINMYNRLVRELKYGENFRDSTTWRDPDIISRDKIIELLSKRYEPDHDNEHNLFGRNVYLHRQYDNVHLTIFEGGHEQLPQALALIPHQINCDLDVYILTLGDSNAAKEGGWADQLESFLPNSHIVNISRSGRTIGFDNNGRKDLNALRNIRKYLNEAQDHSPQEGFDYIIVSLGTNDTKKIFTEKQDEVSENFKKLLKKIAGHSLVKEGKPQLIFLTPPPIREEDIQEKYKGGNQRLKDLVPTLKTIAEKMNFEVVDVFHPLQNVLDYYSEDGVHMLPEGQKIIAAKIISKLTDDAD